jgi:Domain of unknown function (DUF4347)
MINEFGVAAMKKKPENNLNPKRVASTSSMRLALESRLLFDGAIAATAVEVIDQKTVQDAAKETQQDNQDSTADATTLDTSHTPVAVQDFLHNESVEQKLVPIPDITIGSNRDASLLIVDSRAKGINEILANPPSDTQVKILDASRDGFQQIADLLQKRGNTSDLRIITGAVEGKSWLGSSRITNYINATQTQDLIDWGDGLAANARITFQGENRLSDQTWLNHVQVLTGGQASWTRCCVQRRPD